MKSYFEDVAVLVAIADEGMGATPEIREVAKAHIVVLRDMAREFYAKAVTISCPGVVAGNSTRNSGRLPGRVPFEVEGLGGLVLYASADGRLNTSDGKFVLGSSKAFAVLCCGLRGGPPEPQLKSCSADFPAVEERGDELVSAVRCGMARALEQLAIGDAPDSRVQKGA